MLYNFSTYVGWYCIIIIGRLPPLSHFFYLNIQLFLEVANSNTQNW